MNDMGFVDWIPAISSTSLFAFVLWLFRSLISTRLTKSVQHEFDEKLETIRMIHRKSEESFKAELRAKSAQIEALQSGALSAMISRQTALDTRRIEAADQLWAAVTALAPAKAASHWMAVIKFKEAAKAASENQEFRKVFETLGSSIDLKKLGSINASKARPFISQIAWAYYSAYEAIVILATVKLKILEAGLTVSDALDISSVSKLIQVALPHHTEYIQKHGDNAFHLLLEELELRLLEELQNMLKGAESDKATVELAATIIKEADRIRESISKEQSPGL